jgi:hypothetical protein
MAKGILVKELAHDLFLLSEYALQRPRDLVYCNAHDARSGGACRFASKVAAKQQAYSIKG